MEIAREVIDTQFIKKKIKVDRTVRFTDVMLGLEYKESSMIIHILRSECYTRIKVKSIGDIKNIEISRDKRYIIKLKGDKSIQLNVEPIFNLEDYKYYLDVYHSERTLSKEPLYTFY